MDRIMDVLSEIGLNKYEARSYLFLIGHPRSTAPSVARGSSIPTAKIYDIMNRLIAKGFAIVELGKPKKFSAIDHEIVTKTLMEEKRRRLDELEERMKKAMSNVEKSDGKNGIWVVDGRYKVEALIDKIVQSTEKSLLVRSSSDKLYLKNMISGLEGITVDFKSNPMSSNMINSDGEEMIIYLNKKRAIWIKERKYCRMVKDPTMSIDQIFPLQKYL